MSAGGSRRYSTSGGLLATPVRDEFGRTRSRESVVSFADTMRVHQRRESSPSVGRSPQRPGDHRRMSSASSVGMARPDSMMSFASTSTVNVLRPKKWVRESQSSPSVISCSDSRYPATETFLPRTPGCPDHSGYTIRNSNRTRTHASAFK